VEGIETTGMRDILQNYSVSSFQGYYYSKPVTLEELLNSRFFHKEQMTEE
jgi:EAL domain-containing protein (putative c-di-GMP-specific phosphodiesterase class I)